MGHNPEDLARNGRQVNVKQVMDGWEQVEAVECGGRKAASAGRGVLARRGRGQAREGWGLPAEMPQEASGEDLYARPGGREVRAEVAG